MYNKFNSINDSLIDYLSSIPRDGIEVDFEEERSLISAAARGDQSAKERLICNHMSSIVSIAKKYAGLGIPLEDLINEGVIGVLMAIDKYRPDTGTRFICYSASYAKQQIRLALSKNSAVIRIPNHMINLLRKWNKAKERIERSTGKPASFDEIAETLGISAEVRRHLLNAQNSRTLIGFGNTLHEDSCCKTKQIVADQNPSYRLEMLESELHLANLLDRLSENELKVITLRFGLQGNKPLTWREIGLGLGITREWAKKLQNRAFKKMRINYWTDHNEGSSVNSVGHPSLDKFQFAAKEQDFAAATLEVP